MISSRAPYFASVLKPKAYALIGAALVAAGCAASLIQWEHTSDYIHSITHEGGTLLLDDGRAVVVDAQPYYHSYSQFVSRVRVLGTDGSVLSQQSYEGEPGESLYHFDPAQAFALGNDTIFLSDCMGESFRLDLQTGQVANASMVVNDKHHGVCVAAGVRQGDGSYVLGGRWMEEGRVQKGDVIVKLDSEGYSALPVSLDFAQVGRVVSVVSMHLEPDGSIGAFVRLAGQEGAYVLLRMDGQFNLLDHVVVDNDRYVAPVMEVTNQGKYLVRTANAFRRYDPQLGAWEAMPVTLAPGAVSMHRTPAGDVLVVSAPPTVTKNASIQVTAVGSHGALKWQHSYAVPESRQGTVVAPIIAVAPEGKFTLTYGHARYVISGAYIVEKTAGVQAYPVHTAYLKTFVHFIDAKGKQFNLASLPVAKASIVRDFESYIDEGASCTSGVDIRQTRYVNDKTIGLAGVRRCIDGVISGEFNTHVAQTVLRLALP